MFYRDTKIRGGLHIMCEFSEYGNIVELTGIWVKRKNGKFRMARWLSLTDSELDEIMELI